MQIMFKHSVIYHPETNHWMSFR